MRNDKPVLGYFESFINMADIIQKGEGSPDATHEINFIIKDELYIAPAPWNSDAIEIHFDGGKIKLERSAFLELVKDYEARYQKDIHHSAIAELQKAVEVLPTEQAKRFKDVLGSMERVLDATRDNKCK
jgi:hypothetical protein